jgi:hypothetical protein
VQAEGAVRSQVKLGCVAAAVSEVSVGIKATLEHDVRFERSVRGYF